MKNFAFVFPGQGSQAVGMLDGWGDHPAVAQTLQEASDALGEDVGRLIHEGPKEALALTTNTQPVMLVAGVAAWRVWRAEGGALPSAVAGHSLGEYWRWWRRACSRWPRRRRWCACAPPPCRRPCPWVLAPWPPFWGWMLQK